jgi:hypothetical protein
MKNPFAIESDNAQSRPALLTHPRVKFRIFAVAAFAVLLMVGLTLLSRKSEEPKTWMLTWSGTLSLMLIHEESFSLSPTDPVRRTITYNIGPFHLTRFVFNPKALPQRIPVAHEPTNLIDQRSLYFPPGSPSNTAHRAAQEVRHATK